MAGDGFPAVIQMGGTPPADDARMLPLNAVLVAAVADERAVEADWMPMRLRLRLLLQLPPLRDDAGDRDAHWLHSVCQDALVVVEVAAGLAVPGVDVRRVVLHQVG